MIEVKNVTKKYGDFYAVRNINFTVNDGEIVGFLGRNGAGKSTTMNMITGFIEPTSGQILVGGFDIDKKPKKVKKQIGYMPEGTPLYSDLTVREFVSYMADLKMIPRKEKKAAVEKAIRETGLEKVQKNLTKILSRGYKQRVSMAGAIVGDPKILILDEPTVGLDPKQVIEIRELIKSFRKDHTVIISSHILSEISQICEKVIVIDKGEILAVDTPENLEKRSEKDQVIEIVVEEPEDKKVSTIKEEIKEIKEIAFVEEKEDGSKLYKIFAENGTDLRKTISQTCAKSNIIILEMKRQEASLEDAFVELVEGRTEYSQKEIKKLQYKKEIEQLREKIEEKKARKEEKKQEKLRKKEEKLAKKQEKIENAEKQEEMELDKTENESVEEKQLQENIEKTEKIVLDKENKTENPETVEDEKNSEEENKIDDEQQEEKTEESGKTEEIQKDENDHQILGENQKEEEKGGDK